MVQNNLSDELITVQNGVATKATAQNLNYAFRIPREELEDRLKFHFDSRASSGYDHIVPLRELATIEEILLFKNDDLDSLVRNITLRRDGEKIHPYADGKIQIVRIGPQGLSVGQTFVLTSKVLSIMKNLQGRFRDHCTPGLSKMGPSKVYGVTKNGERAISIYVPPIVEVHQNQSIILDGIHRSYICMSGGTTINAISISNVSHPIPFDPISWDDCHPMEDKPPKDERYRNLRPKLYRDLSVVGVDG